MATIEDTLNKIGSTIEYIFGSDSKPQDIILSAPSEGQTCLEAIGMVARQAHLNRNEWYKGMPYTKTLVSSEYQIQKEFEVN